MGEGRGNSDSERNNGIASELERKKTFGRRGNSEEFPMRWF